MRQENIPGLRHLLLDALRLQKMPALVAARHLETRADRKPNHRHERIHEADAIDVVRARATNQIAHVLVAAQKRVQDGGLDSQTRSGLLWRPSLFPLRGRIDVIADEPAAKPAGMDVIDRTGRLTIERPRDRRQIRLVRDAEVIEALTDAPGVRRGLPVDLLGAESSGDIDGVPIVRGEFSDQPVRPGWRSHIILAPSCGLGTNRFASDAIVVTSSAGSIGLARWIWKPARSAFMRSSVRA